MPVGGNQRRKDISSGLPQNVKIAYRTVGGASDELQRRTAKCGVTGVKQTGHTAHALTVDDQRNVFVQSVDFAEYIDNAVDHCKADVVCPRPGTVKGIKRKDIMEIQSPLR